MVDFRIRVVVDPTGAQTGTARVRREFQRTENAADRLRNTIQRTFAFVGIGLAIRQLGELSDAFVQLQNRVRIATNGVGNINGTLDRLSAISIRTRAPIAEIAQLFQRASLAADELGASQEELFTFTEAIGQALAIQGGAANTARGALIQLSQAVGSGIVRAEEFNSILEGAFPIALAAARGIDEAGGSVARLRRLVIDGQISSTQFFNAILSQSEELAEQFQRTEPTIRQAFGVLNTGLVRAAENLQVITAPLAGFIRDVGLAVGILGGLDPEEIAPPSQIARLRELATQLETVARSAGALAIALGIRGLSGALTLAVRGVIALSVAIATNPLGALATVLSVAIGALITFGDRLQLTQGSAATVFDFLIGATQEFVVLFTDGFNAISDLLFAFNIDLESIDFLALARNVAFGFDLIVGVVRGSVAVIVEIWRRFSQTTLLEVFTTGADLVLAAVERFINSIITSFNLIPTIDLELISVPRLSEAEDDGRTLGNVFVGAFTGAIGEGLARGFVDRSTQRALNRAAERAANEARVTSDLDNIILGARDRTPVIDVGAQREAREALAGVDIELGGQFSIQGQIEQARLAQEEQLRIVQEGLDQRIISEEEAAERRIQIERRTQGIISGLELETGRFRLQQGEETFGALTDIARTFAGEQSGIFRALFAVEKGFALARAIVEAQVALVNASTLPFPANISETARVAAVNGAAIATIIGQTFSGAGSFQRGVIGLSGPGSSRSDSIPAFLSNGESVITAAGTRNNAEVLSRINRGEVIREGSVTEIGNITFNLPNVRDSDGFRRSAPQTQSYVAT